MSLNLETYQDSVYRVYRVYKMFYRVLVLVNPSPGLGTSESWSCCKHPTEPGTVVVFRDSGARYKTADLLTYLLTQVLVLVHLTSELDLDKARIQCVRKTKNQNVFLCDNFYKTRAILMKFGTQFPE